MEVKGFKDLVDNDIDRTFLDESVFADQHIINGQKLKCVVDQVVTNASSDGVIGVFASGCRIFVRKTMLGRIPVLGELITLDGRRLVVQTVSDDMGMLEIVAQENMQ